jgi:molybdopterin-containing oxidoreductase family membrane subunit
MIGRLKQARKMPGVLAAFGHVDAAVDAIRALRAKGFRDLVVYTPAPNHEIEEALEERVSPVRLITLIGGLTGCAAGFAMTIWMSYDWPLVVGGKTIASIPPYVVIAFELTILIGALSTVAAVALFSVLMGKRGAPFDPRFTDDQIGIFVPAPPDQLRPVEQLLQSAGAVEVRHELA